MQTVKVIPVFTFAELDDGAKEKARDWWRDGMDYVDDDPAIDWLAEVCDALFIDLSAKKVYWQVSCSQGDGSSFCGRVCALKLLAAIESNTLANIAPALDLPTAPTVHRRVRELLESGEASILATCGASPSYGGTFSLRTDSDIRCDGLDDRRHPRISASLAAISEWAESVLDTINDWFFATLQDDCDYQASNECVDGNILANGYEFTAEGKVV